MPQQALTTSRQNASFALPAAAIARGAVAAALLSVAALSDPHMWRAIGRTGLTLAKIVLWYLTNNRG